MALAAPSYSIVLIATYNDPVPYVDSHISFLFTVKDPCTIANGNSWIAKTISNIYTGVLVPVTSDISTKDSASVTYGNNDGFNFCGPRTYTLTVK